MDNTTGTAIGKATGGDAWIEEVRTLYRSPKDQCERAARDFLTTGDWLERS